MIQKAPEHPSHLFRLKKSSILQIVLGLVVIILLLPQLKQFAKSWDYLQSLSPQWFIVAILFMSLTILFAALVYIVLVPARLPFFRTASIQLATYFTNRLLPSGLGGIGFNALYLVRQAKLSRTEAAVYATANNLVGFVAFSLSVLIASLVDSSNISISAPKPIYIIIGIFVVALASVIGLTIKKIQRKIVDFAGHLFGVILEIIKHPLRLTGSILLSTGITVSYVCVLWASTKSVGINMSVIDLFLAFVAGNAALTVSPTPGGIGAVEAAVTAVLVSAGSDASLALAAVVVYRTVSYWLPVIPGFLAFRNTNNKSYV